MKEIVPSILSANFSRLKEEIHSVENCGATRLHLDVMDGHFVPNITFGPMIISAIRKLTRLHLETHLMIENPGKFLEEFISSGSDTIILHLETCPDPEELLSKIRNSGAKTGLSINPETPAEAVPEHLIPLVDHILIMTVHPGFGGQKMITSSLEKSRRFASFKQPDSIIEIDGGVGESTIPICKDYPIDLYVAGSAVFHGGNPCDNFRKLTKLLGET